MGISFTLIVSLQNKCTGFCKNDTATFMCPQTWALIWDGRDCQLRWGDNYSFAMQIPTSMLLTMDRMR